MLHKTEVAFEDEFYVYVLTKLKSDHAMNDTLPWQIGAEKTVVIGVKLL